MWSARHHGRDRGDGVTAIVLGVATLASATPAVANATSTSDSAKVRFVDMAVTPDYPDGTPVDVYGGDDGDHTSGQRRKRSPR